MYLSSAAGRFASAQVSHFNDPSANIASNRHCLRGFGPSASEQPVARPENPTARRPVAAGDPDSRSRPNRGPCGACCSNANLNWGSDDFRVCPGPSCAQSPGPGGCLVLVNIPLHVMIGDLPARQRPCVSSPKAARSRAGFRDSAHNSQRSNLNPRPPGQPTGQAHTPEPAQEQT